MTKLLAQIHFVVGFVPPSLLENLVDTLLNDASAFNQSLEHRILGQISIPKFRRPVAELLDLWAKENPDWNSSALATALMSSAYSVRQSRQEVDVELVWTGPEVTTIPLRRTDRVLLQLIKEARKEITLISFAVYKIPEIAQALLEALNQGVKVRFIAENPEVADKITFGIKEALGKEIIEQAQVFIWPKHKRPVDNEGRYGSLHIKCAIADSYKLFITSANLTQYAFTLNMEMGVLIQSHYLANQVERQIEDLIKHGILALI
jgi:phosphatidylserine/phosphatidylglycerophosphate/cardiolipin synthase-like enzyme